MIQKKRAAVKYLSLLAAVCLLLVFTGNLWAESFKGVTLKALIGAGGEAPLLTYHTDYLEQKLGLKIKIISQPDPQHYQLCMKDWMIGGGSYDIVTLLPRWNAEFMGMGYLLPIGDYLKSDPEAMKDYEDIVEKYRKLYCEWGGEIYSIVVDGDGAILYYRKDILGDPAHQAKFQAKYGYNLPVPPKTWDQLLDVAEFFAGWDWDNDGKKNYGCYFMTFNPEAVILHYLPIFMTVSNGLLAFDEEVHPQINNEYGIEALKILRKVLDTSPPGYLGIDYVGSWKLVWDGTLAMSLNYGDVGKYLLYGGEGAREGCGPHWRGKLGYAQWPGLYHEGKFVSFNPLFYGRIMAGTRFTKHPEAVRAALRELLRPERKMISLSDVTSCADVYAYSARDAENWTIPVEQEFIDAYLGALDHGVPHLMVPGAEEYHRALGRQIIGYIQGKYDEKTTLANIEKEWEDITNRLSRGKQQAAWSTYLERMLEIGFRLK